MDKKILQVQIAMLRVLTLTPPKESCKSICKNYNNNFDSTFHLPMSICCCRTRTQHKIVIIVTIQNTKVKYLSTLCTKLLERSTFYNYKDEVFNKIPNDWKFMAYGGISTLLNLSISWYKRPVIQLKNFWMISVVFNILFVLWFIYLNMILLIVAWLNEMIEFGRYLK